MQWEISVKIHTWMLCISDLASLWLLKNKRPNWCHLLFYFTSYVLNIFRTLRHPSSGPCDFSIISPHWSCVLVSVWLVWSGIRVAGCFSLLHGYHPNATTPKLQHTSNQEHTTNVLIQQNSRKLLMMDILMSETCWAHKKWNRLASDIKLVFDTWLNLQKRISFLRLFRTSKNSPKFTVTVFIKVLFVPITLV